MNTDTNRLLEKADELDIAALGCKGLINFQGAVLEERLKKGMKIRFLVPDKDSPFIIQKEKDENSTPGDIKKAIEDLLVWIAKVRARNNLTPGQIQIRKYNCLPIESIMRIDQELFIGPFMVGKISQLTMAYRYKRGGKGYSYYTDYFNNIWNNELTTSDLNS